MWKENHNVEEVLLLKMFNDRDKYAFGVVYTKYYMEFINFATRLFQTYPNAPEDVLQDVFTSLWNNKKRGFDSFEKLKVYIYVALKNKLKEICNHHKCIHKYNDTFRDENSLSILVAECEVISLIDAAMNILPEECAKVFRLHLEDWDIKEIAIKLGKSESTVYKQKKKSEEILKSRFSKDKFLLIMMILN